MSDLFQTVETGKRTLVAYQQALNVVGHNIANVNTPGFSRQRAILKSTEPIGSIGTGVEVTAVRRLRDEFLDSQFRAENPSFGRWKSLSQTLSRAEEIFLEPSEYGLGSLLDDFWNGWQDLVNNPEGAASRYALRGVAESLTDGFHRLSNQLEELRLSLDSEITQRVEEVNHIAGEIAELNAIISEVEGGGKSANDLRDKRDLLIDQLSEILDLRTLEKEDGSVSITVGGRFLVEGGSVEELALSIVPEGRIPVWRRDGNSVDIADGRLKGLMEARNDTIPLYQRKLDDLAKGLVNSINAIHRRGFGLDGSSGVDQKALVFIDQISSALALIRRIRKRSIHM